MDLIFGAQHNTYLGINKAAEKMNRIVSLSTGASLGNEVWLPVLRSGLNC